MSGSSSPSRSGNISYINPSLNSSNNQPNSFASAATGAKTTSNSSSNVKLSSAELLSMLKKPVINANNSSGSVGSGSNSNSHTVTSTSGFSSTEAVKQLSVPIVHSFKEDDYSLQGLINLIKACQSIDRNIFALGLDLENDAGLPLNQDEPLRETLLSPWFDESSGNEEQLRDGRKSAATQRNGHGHEYNAGFLGLEGSFGVLSGTTATTTTTTTSTTNPKSPFLSGRRPSALDSIIPPCYHVPSLPAPITKITSFSDETLFYIFYAMPGDRMQELAARELFARGWRFHKPTKAWISMTESRDNNVTSGGNNVQFKAALNEALNFFVFDQSTWNKVKRSLTLQSGDLEDYKPASSSSNMNNSHSGTTSPVGSPEMIMHGSGTLHSTSVTH